MWLHLYPFHFLQPKDDEGQNYTPNSSIKQNDLIYLLYAENIQKHCKWLTEL